MKRKFFKNYNDGTVTDKPIQHLKDITAPALPSVKMSVLVGALPSQLSAVLTAVLLIVGSTEAAFLASLAAKGSRESVDRAVEFLDSMIEEEFISEDSRDPIKKVMRRFTKYR